MKTFLPILDKLALMLYLKQLIISALLLPLLKPEVKNQSTNVHHFHPSFSLTQQNLLNPFSAPMFTLQLQVSPPLPISNQPNKFLVPIDEYFNSKIRSTRVITRSRADNLSTPLDMFSFDGNINDNNLRMDDKDLFPFRGNRDDGGKDYDKDPEFADILGSCLDDPDKARSKMEERLRKKRNRILHTKTGSAVPMKVMFNTFEFSSSYIWLEFYNAPLDKDVSLICDTFRSWHIVGRLGGFNSMNMQLSQSPLDKRPTYDAIEGANVTPTTFYNIGDLEIQDNLARIWVDIGTVEPLILDILINTLTQLSTDFIGIKQVTFGGSEFESWKENLKTEETGYSVHKI